MKCMPEWAKRWYVARQMKKFSEEEKRVIRYILVFEAVSTIELFQQFEVDVVCSAILLGLRTHILIRNDSMRKLEQAICEAVEAIG